jgi:hypothetical protein
LLLMIGNDGLRVLMEKWVAALLSAVSVLILPHQNPHPVTTPTQATPVIYRVGGSVHRKAMNPTTYRLFVRFGA